MLPPELMFEKQDLSIISLLFIPPHLKFCFDQSCSKTVSVECKALFVIMEQKASLHVMHKAMRFTTQLITEGDDSTEHIIISIP